MAVGWTGAGGTFNCIDLSVTIVEPSTRGTAPLPVNGNRSVSAGCSILARRPFRAGVHNIPLVLSMCVRRSHGVTQRERLESYINKRA